MSMTQIPLRAMEALVRASADTPSKSETHPATTRKTVLEMPMMEICGGKISRIVNFHLSTYVA